ncbi:GNAT family N-acetyltransferase [Pseudoroseomonas globiformis]|uniref:GNAT family N-acetyltransferase n=1 Tax=Teichococcus globiformis TaxID=2307229 RepID=A0ABV7G5U9_9PROT
MSIDGFRIRRLLEADAEEFRAIRLEALQRHPEAFGASLEDEAARSLAFFAMRLKENAVFGGWVPEEPSLAGIMALHFPSAAKTRHKARLWGVYLRPVARGRSLAPALLRSVLNHARERVEEVGLSVTAGNAAAERLYEQAGFASFGSEPRALKIGEAYHDERLMLLRF